MIRLTAQEVIAIHDQVISPSEIQGLAMDKSIEAIIGRIENRAMYGQVRDIYALAACYACFIAVGHAFHDGNKRTAFACMDACLARNGVNLSYDARSAGDHIIMAVRREINESELAEMGGSATGRGR